MDAVPAGLLADAHVAPPSPHRAMLWYAAECGQGLFESNKVHAPRSFRVSTATDSDDKIQPVQLLVKQRSGSQSVDKLAEAPQSFAHDSKHCNHPDLLLSRPNNKSESNRNNNHKPQCKSPKTNKWLTLLTWSGLEYAKNASVSQKQGTCPTLPHGGAGGMHSTPLYAFLTLYCCPSNPTHSKQKVKYAQRCGMQ